VLLDRCRWHRFAELQRAELRALIEAGGPR
jgi:hypothetical protein